VGRDVTRRRFAMVRFRVATAVDSLASGERVACEVRQSSRIARLNVPRLEADKFWSQIT
jgi:hypothetical protein